MPAKNDLTKYKRPNKSGGILPQKLTEANDATPAAKADNPFRGEKNKGGRPSKTATEKRSERVLMSFNKKQMEAIRKQAGLAQDATFLYHKLIEAGVIPPE